MSFLNKIPDTVGITVSTNTTIYSGLTGIFSSITNWNWTSIIASTVAILGLAMNVYFQRRRDKRERMESQARIDELKARTMAYQRGEKV